MVGVYQRIRPTIDRVQVNMIIADISTNEGRYRKIIQPNIVGTILNENIK